MSQKSDIPPTEPSASSATATAPKPSRSKPSTPGASLVPKLDEMKSGVVERRAYWVGALPSCPLRSLDLHGVDFPIATENVRPNPNGGMTIRIPVVGRIARLSADDLDRLRARLPRTVIRFLDPPAKATNGLGVGASVDGSVGGDQSPQRRGKPVTIPTAEDIAFRRQNKLPLNQYEPHEWDEPAARYVFAVLCEDQKNPQCGGVYPEPLEVTGLP